MKKPTKTRRHFPKPISAKRPTSRKTAQTTQRQTKPAEQAQQAAPKAEAGNEARPMGLNPIHGASYIAPESSIMMYARNQDVASDFRQKAVNYRVAFGNFRSADPSNYSMILNAIDELTQARADLIAARSRVLKLHESNV